jgi:VIT1/CCC1 family predicted Fe2+/Mn2+ transporter
MNDGNGNNNTKLEIGHTFGVISGIITSIGLILGLYGANISLKPIIVSLASIAISDGISDAFGIYYATKNNNYTNSDAYEQGMNTLVIKVICPLLMVIPFYVTSINKAVIINSIASLIVIYVMSLKIFKNQTEAITNTGICIGAIFLSYNVGLLLK